MLAQLLPALEHTREAGHGPQNLLEDMSERHVEFTRVPVINLHTWIGLSTRTMD